MSPTNPAWLLLITNLPGQNRTVRMRTWRALRAAGVGLLRDGVYALPQSGAARKIFDEQAAEIRSAGGVAYIMALHADSTEQHQALVALFDRSAEYQALGARLNRCTKELAKLAEPDARRRLGQLARDVAATIAIDFFPGPSQTQVQSVLGDLEASLNARFSPDEPSAAYRKIPRRDPGDYHGRTWATREHLWIDRLCSAWLICRFIDPEARFIWLKRPKDCPKRAVGFDFDGASFTHVGSKVTFEVLLASFGLGGDPALERLGALVHFLDVGGLSVPEAAGLAAIIAGARALQAGDDALLEHITPVLDSLYQTYSTSAHMAAPLCISLHIW